MSPPRSAPADAAVVAAPAPSASPGPAPGATGSPDPDAPRSRLSEPGLLAVVAALVLPVAFSGETYYPFWAPRAAVCLLLLGPGLVVLARLARAGDRAAQLGALFLVAAGASALLSGRAVLALTGAPNWGTGLLPAAAFVAAWALARTAGDERLRQLLLALVAGAVLNALVAWLQARNLVPISLDSPGRSAGLMGNPVHLGALSAAAIALAADLVRRSRRPAAWLGAVFLLAGAAQLSGGRSAVGLMILATVAGVWRAGRRTGAAIAVAVAAGVLVATAWAGSSAVTASSRSVGAASTGQVSERAGLWRLSLDATLERPVLGWGPGRFEAATTPRYTAAVSEGGVKVYEDAHNWIVEYATTTGFVGLAILLAWLAVAARRTRGPLARFALVVGLFLLVEPQSVGLTPLALLALGAATPAPAGWVPARRWRVASALAFAACAAAALVLLTGQVLLRQGALNTAIGSQERAAAILPPWPDVSLAGSRIEAFTGLHSAPDRARALALARQATRRDPDSASAWSYLGQLESIWGSPARAGAAIERAFARNPWSAENLLRRAALAERTGDRAVVADSCRRLRAVGKVPTVCGGPATVIP